jgi:WD40 repeat protein
VSEGAGARLRQSWPAQPARRGITALAAAPDGLALYSAARDGSLWRHEVGAPAAAAASVLGQHAMAATALALGPGGGPQLLVSGSRDGTLRTWDLATAAMAAEKKTPQNTVTGLCWVPGAAAAVAQSSEDKVLRVWDVRALAVAMAFPAQQYLHVRARWSSRAPLMPGRRQTCVAAAADGYTLATGANGFNGHGCAVTVRPGPMHRLISR